MAAQHFFLGQAYLGHRMIPDIRVYPGLERHYHHSYAYFCMRCGDIWGRLIHDKAVLTQCTVRPCIDHGEGRFSQTWEWPETCTNFDNDWPPDAIAHEFNAELKLVEHTPTQGVF